MEIVYILNPWNWCISSTQPPGSGAPDEGAPTQRCAACHARLPGASMLQNYRGDHLKGQGT